MPGPHLVLCVASHGWGHLSQSVPIARALHARIPGLRTTVRTGLPAAVVRARFAEAGLPEPALSHDDTEFGFVMRDALSIDDETSLARYRALFAERDARTARERDALRALGADAVLANVGWLPIAAGASLGLPAFGACSLNWADLLAARHPDRAEVEPIVAWMTEAYARADALFALQPGMPFERFANRVAAAPMARVGAARRAALRVALGVAADARVVLMAFGGLPMPLDTGSWKLPEGWHAIVFAQGARDGPATTAGAALDWPFADLLASVDLLVAKPGYGTFAEAGFVSRDTLVVPRDDWPESPYLVDWLARHARVATLALADLRAGRIAEAVAALEARPRRAAASGDGALAIAETIAARLGAPP
jgi:hypothetical protein